jgi:hypothetical protein
VLDEILRDDRNAEHGVDIISAMNATQLWVGLSLPGVSDIELVTT